MKAVLTQDEAWFDENNSEELPTRINSNIIEIEQATGKQLGILIYGIGNALGSISK